MNTNFSNTKKGQLTTKQMAKKLYDDGYNRPDIVERLHTSKKVSPGLMGTYLDHNEPNSYTRKDISELWKKEVEREKQEERRMKESDERRRIQKEEAERKFRQGVKNPRYHPRGWL